MNIPVYKLEDFDRILSGFQKSVRKKESCFFSEAMFSMMKRLHDDDIRLIFLSQLSVVMYLMEPVAVVIDLENELDIEQSGAICMKRSESVMLSHYLNRLKRASDPVEKERLLEEMREVCNEYHSFRKVMVYAGLTDEYETLLSACRESWKQNRTTPSLEEK
jgi:hypothetical protein